MFPQPRGPLDRVEDGKVRVRVREGRNGAWDPTVQDGAPAGGPPHPPEELPGGSREESQMRWTAVLLNKLTGLQSDVSNRVSTF